MNNMAKCILQMEHTHQHIRSIVRNGAIATMWMWISTLDNNIRAEITASVHSLKRIEAENSECYSKLEAVISSYRLAFDYTDLTTKFYLLRLCKFSLPPFLSFSLNFSLPQSLSYSVRMSISFVCNICLKGESMQTVASESTQIVVRICHVIEVQPTDWKLPIYFDLMKLSNCILCEKLLTYLICNVDVGLLLDLKTLWWKSNWKFSCHTNISVFKMTFGRLLNLFKIDFSVCSCVCNNNTEHQKKCVQVFHWKYWASFKTNLFI